MVRTQTTNTWNTQQAAAWLGVNQRLLIDWLEQGLLPAIPVGGRMTQNMGRGKKRRQRRVAKFIIPREAFIRAWENFQPPVEEKPQPRRSRRTAISRPKAA